MPFLRLVELSEGDNVRVIEHFKNLGLLECLLFLTLTHIRNVHLLDDTKVTIALTLHEIRLAKGTLS